MKLNLKIILISAGIVLVGGVIILIVLLTRPSDTSQTTAPTTLTQPTTTAEPETNIHLFHDGQSSYSIVIPANPSSDILFAANELVSFFHEATGYVLPVESDTELVFDEEHFHLSIGNTTIKEGSGVRVSYEEYGLDALKLVRLGNTIIMAGSTDAGAMYAMYEFLERTFNLEVYAVDEWYIDTEVETAYIKDFDVLEVPLFPRRSVGLFTYTMNETYRNRMRQELYNDGWIMWSHSHFRILPPDTYYAEHPDWYSPDQTQLCLTNDEMRAEFTRVVIDLVRDHPEHGYIMLGQEDINTFCTCPDCVELIETYKESGVMMRFINQVADDVQAYIDEHEPGRIFFVCTFGYHKTQYAPANKNAEGIFVPIDDSVLPRDNVMIMVAPIRACNSHHYLSECNGDTEQVLRSWDAVAHDHIFVWMYNKIFNQYFIPFNNFSTLVDNYQILADMGVQFVYHQGNKETEAGGLQELMSYVQAKLMWDNKQNPDVLASDFIEHFYKDAAPHFQEYYDLLRMTYAIWEQRDHIHTYNSGSIALNTYNQNYWTRDYLDRLDELFVLMLESVADYEISDPDLYETLVLRIKKERLTVQILYLNFYFDEFTYDEAAEMIDDFEYICSRFGITVWREKYGIRNVPESLISVLVASWRSALQLK
jgi:hypothetical protein